MSVTAAELYEYSLTFELDQEIARRTAVGRSYYAAYHSAEAWHDRLPSAGVFAEGVGMHEALIGGLTNPSVTGDLGLRSRSIGYMLRLAKRARNKADYELEAELTHADVTQCAANAKQILEKTA